ncbi:unnamed protein product [Lota lota]
MEEEDEEGGVEETEGDIAAPEENEEESPIETEPENDEEMLSDKKEHDSNAPEEDEAQRRDRGIQCRKHSEQATHDKGQSGSEGAVEGRASPDLAQQLPEDVSLECTATSGPGDSRDLCDPPFGGVRHYSPLASVPLLLTATHPYDRTTSTSSQPQGTQSLHNTLLDQALFQPALKPTETEMVQVGYTRRSIRYRGRRRLMVLPQLPELDLGEVVDRPPLPPKKKTRTLYTTDQLEHLESLFQDDHYPDAEKRKVIAASVGVTPQRIMVWFQNRRAKWRKMERSTTGKGENKQSRVGSSSIALQHTNPSLSARVALPKSGAGSLSLHPPSVAHSHPSAAPGFPVPPGPALPSYGALLASLTSQSQPGPMDTGQNQPPSLGGSSEYNPSPIHSPPPLRRASLPLFASTYNPNPTLPMLSTPAHTPPLFLEALEGSSFLAHLDYPGREPQILHSDTSSLFDYGERLDYLTSTSQQNISNHNSYSYQPQASYPSSQTQCLTYLTPSPYLTPNPPESNPTSYLTFGPGAGSNGVVTYAAGGHAYFQPHTNPGQILLQTAGHHGGTPAYQSYSWGNMRGQPAVVQRAQCPSSYSGTHQQPSSTSTLPSASFFPRGSHGPSNPQRSSYHTQTHASTTTTNDSIVITHKPPTTLPAPGHKADGGPQHPRAAGLPAQVSPASSGSQTAPSCVKIEYDSPDEIHSHFHCDFSPIHF